MDDSRTDVVFVAADGEVHCSPNGGDTWAHFGGSDGLIDYIRLVLVNRVRPGRCLCGRRRK